MNLKQKAIALEDMLKTSGWRILEKYLLKNSTPTIVPVDGLDSVIKQAYKNGVCQGHKEVLNFIKVTIDSAKRIHTNDIQNINPFKLK